MNTARLLVPIFTLPDFLYLLLDFLLAGFRLNDGRQKELHAVHPPGCVSPLFSVISLLSPVTFLLIQRPRYWYIRC